jgi:pimeloyl-ACP methyl ester carboxylesterase
MTTTTFAKTNIDCNKHLINLTPTLKIWTERYGRGKPVIVLLNGGGDTIDSEWRNIIPSIAKKATVFAYDRAGQGSSSGLISFAPRTAKGIVTRLRQLLAKSDLSPPYILVAHSIGGLYAQYFAKQYPHEVEALVMINGNLVLQQYPKKILGVDKKTLLYVEKANAEHLQKLTNELHAALTQHKALSKQQKKSQIEYSLEVMGKKQSAQQVMQAPVFAKALRITVLSSGTFALETKLQESFAEQVPHHNVHLFPACGHYIQNCQPNDVNTAIIQMIAELTH